MASCPFCELPTGRALEAMALVHAVEAAYPASPGHTLIVPSRHVASYFDLTKDERRDLWLIVTLVRGRSGLMLKPDGYNIGINDGIAAEQTVPHVHAPDPRPWNETRPAPPLPPVLRYPGCTERPLPDAQFPSA